MKRKPRYVRKRSKLPLILCGVAALLVALICLMLFIPKNENNQPAAPTEAPVTTAAAAVETTIAPTVPPTEETVPVETTEPVMLDSMAELLAENPDTVGWIKIADTKLDYPLMHTPNDPEKYLHMNFDGEYDYAGLPFIDANCSMSPESDNLIIYGHNMQNGTAFRALMGYDVMHYWEAHPTISLTTLYEEREYEIIAAFYDRVYYTYEDCFKFYKFIDAENEEQFNEAMDYYKEKALYDTGVTAEYGDKLITLVTCAYHVDNGRFVVVAKEATGN